MATSSGLRKFLAAIRVTTGLVSSAGRGAGSPSAPYTNDRIPRDSPRVVVQVLSLEVWGFRVSECLRAVHERLDSARLAYGSGFQP
jgi:hypothetical protein